ncbi:diguanylate cyclase domain-containing protein [Aliikangiella sp. IMCC44653]
MKKQLVLLKLFVCLIAVANKSSAAQLIDQLPATLAKNWQVCFYFETSEQECAKQDLPLPKSELVRKAKLQIYQKEFIPSSQLKGASLGLLIQQLDDTDAAYVNGELIGRTGQFLPKYETGYRQPRLYLIPHGLIKFNQFNRIEIHTFSARNSVSLTQFSPVIDHFSAMQKQLYIQDRFYLIVASILLLLTIFPAFYFIIVKGNLETAYCFCFLVGFSLVTIARSQLPIQFGLDLNSTFKLEFFMLNFSLVSACLFLFSFFELELRKVYIVGLCALGLTSVTLIIWPYAIHIRQLAEFSYLFSALMSFVIAGSAFVISIHKQRKYAIVIGISFFLGWLSIVYDALMHANILFGIDLTINKKLTPFFSVLLGITILLTMTHKYWTFFKGSTFDHLTGTLLRPAFFQRLSEEMHRSRRGDLTLLISVIEIQQAKKLSANFSYSLGNHLLMTVSSSLTKVLRPYDLICRFSDEQFCIATTVKSQKNAEACIDRIHNELISIQQPINEEIDLYVDARIGSVIYNDEQHLSVSHLVQDANYALSKAKNESKQSFLLIQSPLINL